MPTRAPVPQQHSQRRANAGQAAQPAAQSRRPGQAAEAAEDLIDGLLAEDAARYPGPQEQHRQGQEQQLGQEEHGQQDQDEVQIVEPPQEVRNW